MSWRHRMKWVSLSSSACTLSAEFAVGCLFGKILAGHLCSSTGKGSSQIWAWLFGTNRVFTLPMHAHRSYSRNPRRCYLLGGWLTWTYFGWLWAFSRCGLELCLCSLFGCLSSHNGLLVHPASLLSANTPWHCYKTRGQELDSGRYFGSCQNHFDHSHSIIDG